MVAAWALVTKFGATQANVALVLGCSQPTIASWVKEMNYRKEIQGLTNELSEAQAYIEDLQDELRYLEDLTK